jgi:DNA processing protein
LAALPDAPAVLSAIGDLGLLGRPTLAVVGAREASMAACRLAGELAGALGAAGFVVASGLARGIDGAAHQAALATGTVAVLAGGIDQVYPPQNAGLHAAIAAGGLLLSESPWGAPPVARAFPRRNRIVSGLSKGVVVIEAAARSGSLITAHRAAEQGRDVFVVPGSPADPRYAGSNSLIRDGAILTRDINDILGVLGAPRSEPQVLVKPRGNPTHPEAAQVLSALGSVPTLVDELSSRRPRPRRSTNIWAPPTRFWPRSAMSATSRPRTARSIRTTISDDLGGRSQGGQAAQRHRQGVKGADG